MWLLQLCQLQLPSVEFKVVKGEVGKELVAGISQPAKAPAVETGAVQTRGAAGEHTAAGTESNRISGGVRR